MALADRFRIDRRWAAFVLVLLLVLTGVAGYLLVTTGPKSQRPTVWGAITRQASGEQMPKDAALQAFSYLYKVAIPGVTLPPGDDAKDKPTSGSGAMRWVMRYWAKLTPDQQAVIKRYTEPGPNDTVVDIDLTAELPRYVGAADGTPPTGPPPDPARGRPLPVDLDRPLPAGAPGPVRQPAADAPAQDLTDAFKADILANIAHIGPRLGIAPISEGFAIWKNVTLTMSETDGGNTFFETHARIDPFGGYSPCNITAYKNAWSGESASGGNVSAGIHVYLTHEVVHCYQNVIWGDVPTSLSIPPWITEGSALWLAADDTKIVETMVPSQWLDGWFRFPGQALTTRTYDGFGYYALLDHLGRPLWGLMRDAWIAARASPNGNRSNPYIQVLDGDATDVRDAWGPSFLREPSWSDPWNTHGFGLPDDAQVFRNPIEALAQGWTGDVESRANVVNTVTASAHEIVLIATGANGLASVHEMGGNAVSVVGFTSRRFCVQGDCVCPPRTLHEGERMADEDLNLPFAMTVNAGLGGATWRVVALSLEEECGKQDEPGPPCSGDCAGSNGDPHLTTVNARHYDLQSAGEFVLLRSRDGAVELQARQVPYADSETVSINSAVAARVNGKRVGVYQGPLDAMRVLVDGQPVDIEGMPVDLGGGGRVDDLQAGDRTGVVIDLPDGTTVYAIALGEHGINVRVDPSPTLRANGMGILGRVPRGGAALPLMPDGSMLPRLNDVSAKYDQTYKTFADAWRVTDANTLFDYDAGQSTATFQRRDFPTKVPPSLASFSAEQQAAAAAQCAEVHDLVLRDQCILDLLLTGNQGFLGAYSVTSRFVQALVTSAPASGGPSASPRPTATPGPTNTPIPTASIPATIQAGKVGPVMNGLRNIRGSAVADDGTIYIATALPGPEDKGQFVAIDSRAGTVLKSVPTVWYGRVAIAAGSVWAGDLDSLIECGLTRFEPKTLAVQAKIKVPCDLSGAQFVAFQDAIWFIDRTGADIDGRGGHLRMIDPATNAVGGTAVELPFLNGNLYATKSSIFWNDNATVYRWRPGETAFTLMGEAMRGALSFAGNGVWEQNIGALVFHGEPDGAAERELTVDGPMVAVDESAVYTSETEDGIGALIRYPSDGSGGVPIARLEGDPSAIQGRDLGYSGGTLGFSPDGRTAVELWQSLESDGTVTLFLQWIGLP